MNVNNTVLRSGTDQLSKFNELLFTDSTREEKNFRNRRNRKTSSNKNNYIFYSTNVMNKDRPFEYSQKRTIIDALYKARLIQYMEWYKILLELRQQYDLIVIE
jgi:hypothetical protein